MNFFSVFVLILAQANQPDCQSPFTRTEVMVCARYHSPQIRAEMEQVQVAQGVHESARVLLPSNPYVSVVFGHRTNSVGLRAVNVTGTLSQEINIAGQRRKRMEAAQAQVTASKQRVEQTEREIIAEALIAYYDVLAAQAEVAAIRHLLTTSQQLETIASERLKAGLGTSVDSDLAAAERAQVEETAVLAQGRVNIALARFAAFVGLDPTAHLPQVQGDLSPMPIPKHTLVQFGKQALAVHPELAVVRSERQSESAQLKLLRRSRIPNPSLSLFAQKDAFDEQVFGGGIGFPIPLPAPVGHTYKGQMATSHARIREADARLSAVERKLQLDVAVAFHEYQTRREVVDVYAQEIAVRAEQTLQDLAAEIAHGKLILAEALVTQQTLQDLFLRTIEAKHSLAIASVRLLLAVGTAFAESDS